MPSQNLARSRRSGATQHKARDANAGQVSKRMQSRSWGHVLSIIVGVSAVIAALAGTAWWFILQDWQPTGELPAYVQDGSGANATVPSVYSYRIVKKHKHDPKAFTQGLLWLNGTFYESTGLYGESAVREVRLDGRVVREVRLAQNDFGEGLVYWKKELLQLLWKRGDVYRFAAQAGPGGHLKRKKSKLKTPFKDGWGFTEDGESLLVTDSGPDVCFLDPESLTSRRCVRVRDAGRAVEMLNELEMIDGELWANVFGKDCIARIAPQTGVVLGWVLLSDLIDRHAEQAAARSARRQPPDVLNGIAWDAENRRLFVTGKLWPHLFEIELVPVEGPDLAQVRRLCIPTENIFGPMKEP